jgi:branched-chain amino acid transport system substrate-binding protein
VNLKLKIELAPGQPDLSSLARDAAAQESDTIVVVASARESARAVKALRGSGYAGPIAGSPTLGRSVFTSSAGAAAEGALFPWIGESAPAFRRSFTARFGTQPDDAAAGAYDAVQLVVAAIREAGLNRARIRDSIAARQTFAGAGGRIEWDVTGQNRRPPVLAVIHEGYAIGR